MNGLQLDMLLAELVSELPMPEETAQLSWAEFLAATCPSSNANDSVDDSAERSLTEQIMKRAGLNARIGSDEAWAPRSIDSDGVEEVWSLERTLRHDPLREQLGEAFVFELQSLLAGRLGPNLRNVMAHGLIAPDRLQGETAIYLWWVILRLIIMPTPAMQAFIERDRTGRELEGASPVAE